MCTGEHRVVVGVVNLHCLVDVNIRIFKSFLVAVPRTVVPTVPLASDESEGCDMFDLSEGTSRDLVRPRSEAPG